jgi:hypothetical protein
MTRSTEANRRYWLLLHAIADKLRPNGQEFNADTWHTWAKSKFLGCEEFRLPNGKTLLIPNSTTGLDVAEFGDYMTQLEAWAHEHDVWLEDVAA